LSKTLSIVFLVIFSLSLVCVIGFDGTDNSASAGWGLIGAIIGCIYSIMATVNLNGKIGVLKNMSIIGIIWSGFSILFILIFINKNIHSAIGWGFLSLIFNIALAIVAINKTDKSDKSDADFTEKLQKLHNLYKEGALTKQEYQKQKDNILK